LSIGRKSKYFLQRSVPAIDRLYKKELEFLSMGSYAGSAKGIADVVIRSSNGTSTGSFLSTNGILDDFVFRYLPPFSHAFYFRISYGTKLHQFIFIDVKI
jgi:hypothetical protein